MSNKGHGNSVDTRLEMILQALEGLEYGTLNIIVHESQITQIERTEKKRFPLEKTATPKEWLPVGRTRQGG
ncbi:YezD family protein [Brevibacillus sp. FSL K6-6036]|uniref:YezD family protein n=1 Tax=Brevibacillus TaxID=55080 RepID=UPI0030CF4EEE